jgi:hypothetical protein
MTDNSKMEVKKRQGISALPVAIPKPPGTSRQTGSQFDRAASGPLSTLMSVVISGKHPIAKVRPSTQNQKFGGSQFGSVPTTADNSG